ncbi:hypothetical protein AVEN_166959-1 [Araneus ventricosus]|uniref:Uncharacterized protein n=1 Tax=Araneus ventricosus TaxID=182803 RepID=A0A4Y2X4W2_ARAVE|nr:hypothetical protein AVEN_104243-1 [Araneus ventricosus]GBO44529.1 hypothetical protein AVEN_166959-1 [Araneus ventricosus]
MGSLCFLGVRSQLFLRSQKVPGSKSDSIEDPPYMTCCSLTLSIRECPKRLFKQKTVTVRISRRNFHPLSLCGIDFTPAARFLFRVVHPTGLREKGVFLIIRTLPAVIVVFEGEGEFSFSLKEEHGRSCILRSLYYNGLRNQRVKSYVVAKRYPADEVRKFGEGDASSCVILVI